MNRAQVALLTTLLAHAKKAEAEGKSIGDLDATAIMAEAEGKAKAENEARAGAINQALQKQSLTFSGVGKFYVRPVDGGEKGKYVACFLPAGGKETVDERTIGDAEMGPGAAYARLRTLSRFIPYILHNRAPNKAERDAWADPSVGDDEV